jgi:hypothetical protein
MARKTAKKGGSQASDSVSKLVTPQTYDNLSQMFSNEFTLTGGRKSTVRKIDINEGLGGEKVMVYNMATQGGKAPAKKKAKKPAAKKGGAAPIPLYEKPVGRMDNIPDPPAAVPSTSQSTLNMSPVPIVQQQLASQKISTMQPIVKNTVYPSLPLYDGPFALGGAKKSKAKTAPKKKTKVAPKKKPAKK